MGFDILYCQSDENDGMTAATVSTGELRETTPFDKVGPSILVRLTKMHSR